MTVEIKVPVLPESVADATIVKWYKKPGESISRDENLVDLETDKVMLEVPAPSDGVLKEIVKQEGSTVLANDVIGLLEAGTVATSQQEPSEPTQPPPQEVKTPQPTEPPQQPTSPQMGQASPSVRRLAAAQEVDVTKVSGTGKKGRVTKIDVGQHLQQEEQLTTTVSAGERQERRVPMSRLRARIAERLLAAKQDTAMLTTFNEINMEPVMSLRARYKEQFEEKYGVRLGLMSFFVKAAVEALKRFPDVNASIDGNDIVYHGYFDVGIAVSTERGLVVPIIRDCDRLTMAKIEESINDFAQKARDNKITMEDMTGGTFTITNGGVFGSLLATPILNPPQSAILGMHNIVKRPVVVNDEIVIRPMMYVALSYDHRIVDGKESVTFLRAVKELIEDPARLILEI